MQRLFGRKKAPGPTLADAADKVNARGDAIDEKINALNTQLTQIKQQMNKLPAGAAKQRLQQRALQVLKQKRMYENQRGQLYNQAFNLEQTSFTQQSVQDSITQVQAMKEASKSLGAQMKQIKISEVDKVHDQLEDLFEDHNEIQDILGRSYAGMDEIDEDELNEELAALDDELLAEEGTTDELPSYLRDDSALPAVPSGPVAAAEGGGGQAAAVDEFGLPTMPMRG